MPAHIYTADFHLTSKVADQYRWLIFPWLINAVDRYNADAVFILGDLTDSKDDHSAELVNKLTDSMVELASKIPIYVIKGNHDYIDVNTPFFGFLRHIPRVHFYSEVGQKVVNGLKCLFLPHTSDPEHDWRNTPWKEFDRVFTHQCYTGAVSSTGRELTGSSLYPLGKVRKDAMIIAGDIHVPQKVGPVTYCGSPHPVYFGDTFQPRILVETDGQLRSVKRSTIKKATIVTEKLSQVLKSDLAAGDQLKVTLSLPRSRFDEYAEARQRIIEWAAERNVILAGVELEEQTVKRESRIVPQPAPQHTRSDTFNRFCESRGVDESLQKLGRQFIE